MGRPKIKYSQTQRILAITRLLRGNGHLTAAQLAHDTGVNLRTIQRDLAMFEREIPAKRKPHSDDRMFTIEKNIPLPKTRRGQRPRGLTAALRLLKVGDSVLVPYEGNTRRAAVGRAGSISSQLGKSIGFVFAMRTLDEGVRIWRIE